MSLPPPVTCERWRFGNHVRVEIRVSETLRRDLKLAADSGIIPVDAKFWVREASHEPLSYVELFAWPGQVLATDYATALMDSFLKPANSEASCNGDSDSAQDAPVTWEAPITLDLPQDARFSPEVNDAIALLKTLADRLAAAVSKTYRERDYIDPSYSVEVRSVRLRFAAERGLRIEVDPAYAVFMLRARAAAARLGRAVERQLCGEGGVNFADETALKELVRVDDEAGGRPVRYRKGDCRWEVDQRITCSRCDTRYDARRFEAIDDPARIVCAECTLNAMCTRPRP